MVLQQPTTTTATAQQRHHRSISSSNSIDDRKQQHQQQECTDETRLVGIADVPIWLRFNPFILTGYRRAPSSVAACTRSFVRWHNETCNVVTHFVGMVYAIHVFVQEFSKFFPSSSSQVVEVCMWGGGCRNNGGLGGGGVGDDTSSSSVVSFNALMASLSLLITFTGSTAYHLYMPSCKSQSSYVALLGCDVRASVLGISFTGLSFLLKGDPCHTSTTRVVFTVLFVIAAIATLAVSAWSKNVKQRMVGIGIFVVFRFFAAVAALSHKITLHNRYLSVWWHAVSLFLLIIGGWFNMSRVPERSHPGKYDCWMNSHNIWHALSLVAGIFCLLGALQDDVDWREMVCDR